MEKLSKEEILKIGNMIAEESDVLANHGTSIINARSIMENGFKFQRTSMVFNEEKDIINMCTYGWKENFAGDAANIIISVPRSFFKSLLNCDDKDYEHFIEVSKTKNTLPTLLDLVTTLDGTSPANYTFHIQRCFVRGMFVYTDNTNYLSFSNNKEDALNHLAYEDNKYFYSNLTLEEQQEIVKEIKERVFGEQRH